MDRSQEGNVVTVDRSQEGNVMTVDRSQEGNVVTVDRSQEGNVVAVDRSQEGNVVTVDRSQEGNVVTVDRSQEGNVVTVDRSQEGNVVTVDRSQEGNVVTVDRSQEGNVVTVDRSQEGNVVTVDRSQEGNVVTVDRSQEGNVVTVDRSQEGNVVYSGSLLLQLCISLLLRKLQMVQNSAARLITGTRRRDHITPVLFSLHRLTVRQRMEFKLLLLVFRAVHHRCPVYNIMTSLVIPYTPTRTLRSADQHLLTIPRYHLERYGRRAFLLQGRHCGTPCLPQLGEPTPLRYSNHS